MNNILFMLLLVESAYAGGDFISPTKLDINKYPNIVTHVMSELKDDYKVKTIDSAGLFDMGAKCNGQKLYGLTYHNMKITEVGGANQDVSGLFTGSGGTQVTFFTMTEKGKMTILFNEVLMDWWGVVDRSNCPPIKVRIRGLGENGMMGERESQLKFKNKKYQE